MSTKQDWTDSDHSGDLIYARVYLVAVVPEERRAEIDAAWDALERYGSEVY